MQQPRENANKRKIIRLAKAGAFLCLAFVAVWCANQMFLRKDIAYRVRANYLRQPANTVDVLIMGTSHALNGLDPSILKDKLGVQAFNMASEGLDIGVLRYQLEECLKTQKPKILLLDTFAFHDFAPNEREEMVRTAFDMVPITSLVKLRAIGELVQGDKSYFYVPFLANHSWWETVKSPNQLLDFHVPEGIGLTHYQAGGTKPESDDGYFSQDLSLLTEEKPLLQRQRQSLEELLRIARENGISVVLVSLPYKVQFGMESVELTKISNFLRAHYQAPPWAYVLDLNQQWSAMEFSYTKDLDNEGHLSDVGCAKVSNYVADYLDRTFEELLP